MHMILLAVLVSSLVEKPAHACSCQRAWVSYPPFGATDVPTDTGINVFLNDLSGVALELHLLSSNGTTGPLVASTTLAEGLVRTLRPAAPLVAGQSYVVTFGGDAAGRFTAGSVPAKRSTPSVSISSVARIDLGEEPSSASCSFARIFPRVQLTGLDTLPDDALLLFRGAGSRGSVAASDVDAIIPKTHLPAAGECGDLRSTLCKPLGDLFEGGSGSCLKVSVRLVDGTIITNEVVVCADGAQDCDGAPVAQEAEEQAGGGGGCVSSEVPGPLGMLFLALSRIRRRLR